MKRKKENNRMGKTRDLFKKIRDTKGTFHAQMGSIKDRNDMDLTEASGPITSWEIDGETVETVSDFIFGGSKITADGDCGHEIKRCLLLGRKVMTNLDSIFKQRFYFANKGASSQGYGFSCGHVWM